MCKRLVLGSASPRRRQLLRGLGLEFEVVPSDIPEVRRAGETIDVFVRRVAMEKAKEVARRRPGCWVLAADTVVVLDGELLGKPAGVDDARDMLRRLSARTHHVLTSVVLCAPDGRTAGKVDVSTAVEFRELSDVEIDAYVASGEPLDKAGAYAIQGGAGSFVRRIEGSYSNVIGLPVDEVRHLLVNVGVLPGPLGSAMRRVPALE